MIKIYRKNSLKNVMIIFFLLTFFLMGCSLSYIEYAIEDTPFREATKMEFSLFNTAIQTNNVSICYQIDPKAEKRREPFDYETETFRLRPHCIFLIAIHTKIPALCEELMDKRNDLQPSQSYKAACIDEANKTR